MDLGREQVVTEADGKTRWTLSVLGPRVIFGFRDWISEQIGDPFAEAERFADKLPAADVLAMVKEAKAVKDQLAGFSIACHLAQQYLKTELGSGMLFKLLLELHHPDVTLEQAFVVLRRFGELKLAEGKDGSVASALATATGSVPNGQPAADNGLSPDHLHPATA